MLIGLVALVGARLVVSDGLPGAGGRLIPFILRTLSGRWISVSAGHPGVILFATSACASCIPAAKALNVVKSRFGSRFDAVMVDVDPREPPSALQGWSLAVGHPVYPLAIDSTGRLAVAYRVEGLGTTIIYNARGRIVERAADPTLGQIEAGLRAAGVKL